MPTDDYYNAIVL